jgi:hypothetical protein
MLMPIFTIVYNNNSTETFEAESKEILIRDFSMADATAFQEDVKEIRWEENGNLYIENVYTGKIKVQKSKKRVA